jgi:hypothetical protein
MEEKGSPPIKVAGIGSTWQEDFAKSYSQKLQEIGYLTKPIQRPDGSYWVGYSYRPFSVKELEETIEILLK